MEFRSRLKNSSMDRQSLSQRLFADPEMTPTSRVSPQPCREHGHSPAWMHLKYGFHCFAVGDSKLVCFVATIGYTVYACPLRSTAKLAEFDFLLSPTVDKIMKPIGFVFESAGYDDDDKIDSRRFYITEVAIWEDRVTIGVLGAAQVNRTSGKKASEVEQDEIPFSIDEVEYDKLLGRLEKFVPRDSDCDSLCSSDDSESEGSEDNIDEEGLNTHASSDDEEVDNTPFGTHVVYSNSYFTFTNNLNYPDIKVTVNPRWCKLEHLGTTLKSKTVVPRHYGDQRETPYISLLVLSAWMLFKAKTNDFCNLRSNSRKLFAEETRKLRAAIVTLSSPFALYIGNVAADVRISEWALVVMIPI